jgi:hypothetical protein
MMHINSDRPWHRARPWLLATQVGFAAAVEKLKQRNRYWLFLVVTKAAASGDWALFEAAMEQAARMKQMNELLASRSAPAIALAYDCAGLPRNLQPLFEAVVTLSWDVSQQVEGIRPGKRLRTLILDKVFRRPEIRRLDVPKDIRDALYA